MTLSIIIVSYNTKKLTIQTLDSVAADLRNSNLTGTHTSEIIIIDNASSDDSVSAIQSWIKNHSDISAHIIVNKRNVGFAKANNTGISKARGDFIFLLNSDTVVHSGAMSALLHTFTQNPTNHQTAYVSSYAGKLDRLGMVSASLQNPDGSYQAQGGDLPNLLNLATHLLFIDDIPFLGSFVPSTQHTGRRTVHSRFSLVQKGWVAATAVMVKKSLIQDIGDLDENIFMYGEDMEWCVRAQNHHWDVAITHTAIVTHYGSASSHNSNAILGELNGYIYIWAKHKPHWQRPVLNALLTIGCVLRIFLFGTILRKHERTKPYKEFLKSQ